MEFSISRRRCCDMMQLLGLFFIFIIDVKENLLHCNACASLLQCFLVLPRSDEEQEDPDPHLARGLAVFGGTMAQQVVEQRH